MEPRPMRPLGQAPALQGRPLADSSASYLNWSRGRPEYYTPSFATFVPPPDDPLSGPRIVLASAAPLASPLTGFSGRRYNPRLSHYTFTLYDPLLAAVQAH